ncbi:MAG: hypothetical protein GXO23_02990 [Crenarchaeota archaeon]|nr:hypothetical protein [Thermoproteota archaeon]
MREKDIVEKLKKEDLTSTELFALYLALLQLRFIALAYDMRDNVETELESILMKQVFYRHLEESTGKVLDKIYDILIKIFTENPRLRNHEHRNIFIEAFEQEFLDTIRDVGLSCIRPWLIPEPWKDFIRTVLERVRKREYVISDQTLSGSVSIWEGELVKDVQTMQNLTLLEKYMLISNICAFGYNVYLVLPFYVQDKAALDIISLSREHALARPIKREELLLEIEKALRKIQPLATTELRDDTLRVRMRDDTRNISITVIDISRAGNIEDIVRKHMRDILIVLCDENRRLIRQLLQSIDNIFIIETADRDPRATMLKTLDLISRIVR